MPDFLRKAIAVSLWALSLAVPSVHGAGMSPDPSGIWYDPAQPGWGMSINQQGGTMFVALFVYDANHDPTWLVASNVVDTGTHLDPIGSEVFAGPLYRTSGPFFSSSTDAAALGVATVGTLQIARINANIALTYTVDATTVSKTVQPQTWRSDIANMLGTFSGGVFLIAPSPCQSQLAINPQFGTFSVSQGSAPDSLLMTWGTGLDTACTMTGAYVQQGTLASLAGPVKCGPVPNPGADVGTLTISEMAVGKHGFSGAAVLQSGACIQAGTAGGTNIAPGAQAPVSPVWHDPTGLWYDALHPGWGMSVMQQGDTVFVVIFVYDANHQPQWFVASNVIDSGQTVVNGVPCADFCFLTSKVFAGTLYRTSGPHFGSTPDSTGLVATPVGNLKLSYAPFNILVLQYSVDGVTVSKVVTAQTWSSNLPDFAGTYGGAILVSRPLFCPDLSSSMIPASTQIKVIQGPTSTQLEWAGAGDTTCTTGAASPFCADQECAPGGYSWSLQCSSPSNHTTVNGSIFINEMKIGSHGFSGAVDISLDGCGYQGTIGGVKR